MKRFDCIKLVFSPVIHYFSAVVLVRYAQDPPLFFTEVLERALDKSNSKTVTRVLVTRSEVSELNVDVDVIRLYTASTYI